MTSELPSSDCLNSHSELLDGIYRLQRHFYDLTRKYYLFGRDTVIQRIAQTPPKSVLEVGCGTGRNLNHIARSIRPLPKLCGLDASQEMLKHARLKALPLASISFEFGFAESFDGEALFQSPQFDCVLFSYSLSMIPDWRGAIQNGLKHLTPEGSMWIVDFWDQSGYPTWFQHLLRKWLDLFHVRFEPNLLEYLLQLSEAGEISLELEPVGRRYSYIAKIHRLTNKSY